MQYLGKLNESHAVVLATSGSAVVPAIPAAGAGAVAAVPAVPVVSAVPAVPVVPAAGAVVAVSAAGSHQVAVALVEAALSDGHHVVHVLLGDLAGPLGEGRWVAAALALASFASLPLLGAGDKTFASGSIFKTTLFLLTKSSDHQEQADYQSQVGTRVPLEGLLISPHNLVKNSSRIVAAKCPYQFVCDASFQPIVTSDFKRWELR